jgi:hypothetical protein
LEYLGNFGLEKAQLGHIALQLGAKIVTNYETKALKETFIIGFKQGHIKYFNF